MKNPDENALPIIFPIYGVSPEEIEGRESLAGKDDKVSSIVIIFSCWNTMVGSAIVSLPWAFQTAGLVMGTIISFCSFVISFYTCNLIIITAKKDKDYIFTLKKYFGKFNAFFLFSFIFFIFLFLIR